ncbi:MAG: hypothetical protein ACI9DF_004367 [Verrucomicrobiales bacterium]|jgi:hypothetical protein
MTAILEVTKDGFFRRYLTTMLVSSSVSVAILSVLDGFLKGLAFKPSHGTSGLLKDSIALLPSAVGSFGVDLVEMAQEFDQLGRWQGADLVDDGVCHRAYAGSLALRRGFVERLAAAGFNGLNLLYRAITMRRAFSPTLRVPDGSIVACRLIAPDG